MGTARDSAVPEARDLLRARLRALTRRPRVLAYGGGLDSFALLLAAIQRGRGEMPDVAVFADVGDPEGLDPAEWPSTYRHIREVARPLCEAHGIEFVWLDTVAWPVRGERSLFQWMRKRNQIPVAGPDRICTIVGKVERFERWLDSRYPDRDVEVWVGFDANESGRTASDPNRGKLRKPRYDRARRHNRYPLIEWDLCRCRGEDLVIRLGFPVPRKSACVYCPYGSRGDWQTFDRELPEWFDQVAEMEAAKPPTSAGKKLSIMGYETLPDGGYRAPPLREFIARTYRPRRIPCAVCGRAQRATKATGCNYLVPAPAVSADGAALGPLYASTRRDRRV